MTEHRKVVTVLFSDVVGSTALGESTDPEALRALLARYFERMKEFVEHHGGTVEKFIGDAVMAVFGVPAVHEDDALRACRAAVEMRDALPELGVEGRIGVNTGEVVTGTEERLATGDAVNVAARLQGAAEPGDILIGEATLEAVRDAVESQSIEPLELKGKAERVPAYRLVAVRKAPERSHEIGFVGREREVAIVGAAWERARANHHCELLTIIGDPGVGKSRLVAEALAGIGGRVVQGRCLPYGEGITYWPVVEVVKQLGALPADGHAAAAIRALLGESTRPSSAEEVAWAFRKLLEDQAPLVVVFDDIQWGDDTFLDLVESVTLLSPGSSVLVLCLARPELQSRRPEWPVALRLDPLPDDDVGELLADLPDELRSRIAAAAGGNPLFLNEMRAMAEENAAVVVPPTLRALLAARLDQLDPAERVVLEGGAVEGEVFHRGAVQALAEDSAQITPRLAALVRRQLIRPERAQLPGDDAFRFRHLLIRDAAYEALPKSVRSELHERFAGWLEEHGTDLVELDEIVGYHLEQAARYRAELGRRDELLNERAARHLAAAARRGIHAGPDARAQSLFVRALELIRPSRLEIHLEIDLSEKLQWDDPARAVEVAEAAAERALAEGDALAEALARACAASYRVFVESDPDVELAERLAREALPLLEEAHDDVGLVHVWFALGYSVANTREQMEDWEHAAERAMHHARAAGIRPGQDFGLTTAVTWGPRPADEALRLLDELGPDFSHPVYDLKRSYLLGSLCRFDEAWSIARGASARLLEFNEPRRALEWLGELSALGGDYSEAVRYHEEMVAMMAEQGQRAFRAAYGSRLGRWLCRLGRYADAEPYIAVARDFYPDDADWRLVQALVDSGRGRHASAERFAREGASLYERTDQIVWVGDAYRDLGTVLAAGGRPDEARDAFDKALAYYERKQNLAMVAQVQPERDALGERAAV
jgi:class 3 adenylate cyclase/tetratricopeptide (TPR) repeat protein